MFPRQCIISSKNTFRALFGLIIFVAMSTNVFGQEITEYQLYYPPVCGARVTYYTPGYFQRNFRNMILLRKFFPKDILVNGINLGHPVDVYDGQDQIAAAIRVGYSPQQLFNQQYVSTQLGMALRPDYAVRGTFSTTIKCYGVDFAPVTLNVRMAGQPITLTPQMTTGAFFSACDLVANQLAPSPERDDDMMIVASILSLLNVQDS